MFGISCSAQLSRRVHRELWHADVGGGDPEARRGERSDRRPARHVVARDEDLPRDARRFARPLEQRGGRGRGRVALVGVDLECGAGIDLRRVVGLVSLRIVGMDRVCVVGRDAGRSRERAVAVVVGAGFSPGAARTALFQTASSGKKSAGAPILPASYAVTESLKACRAKETLFSVDVSSSVSCFMFSLALRSG